MSPIQTEIIPKYLILFDGYCGLCQASVQWVLKRDRKNTFHFASLQSEVAKRILDNFQVQTETIETVVFIKEGKLFMRSDAAIEIAKTLGGKYKLIHGLYIFPKFLRDWVYRLIARYRYRIWGKTEICMIPEPRFKQKFIDES